VIGLGPIIAVQDHLSDREDRKELPAAGERWRTMADDGGRWR